MRRLAMSSRLATLGLSLAAGQASAANAEFQAFFFDVCAAPTGALATRCATTPGGLGNLSGDSESSLNPNQGLGNSAASIGVAQARSKAARERGERLREDGQEPAQDEAARFTAGRLGLLVNVHATWFERDAASDGAERGYDGDSRAAELGLDYRLSERAVVGALLGIERMEYEYDAENPGVNFVPAARAGDVDADTTYLTLFGSWSLGTGGFVELAAGYEQSDGAYRRDSVFQESTRTQPQVEARVSGDADGAVTWIGVNAGVDFTRDTFSVGPYAGLTYAHSTLDAYTERDLNDSGLAMHYAGTERDSLLGHLGVRAGWTVSTGPGVLVPQLRVEYQYEFEDERPQLTAQYALDSAGTRYTLDGDAFDRSSINAGASLSAILAGGWILFADYAVLLENDGFDRDRATLGLRREF